MNAPDPQVGFSPGVGNPNVDPQHGPRRCKKKRLATKRCRLPTLILLLQKKIRLTMFAQSDQLLRWVVSSGKKNGAMRPSRCFTTDGFHAAAEIQPFRHQLQAILAGLAGDT